MLKTILILSIIVGIVLGTIIYKISEMILEMKNIAFKKSLDKNVVEITQTEYEELCKKGWKSNAEIK
jgi:hypothetical protein